MKINYKNLPETTANELITHFLAPGPIVINRHRDATIAAIKAAELLMHCVEEITHKAYFNEVLFILGK